MQKHTNGESVPRSVERMALAAAIENHRQAKSELQDCLDSIEAARESSWSLRTQLEKLQEEARAAKAAEPVPQIVSDVAQRLQTCQRLPDMRNEHNLIVRQAFEYLEPPPPGVEEHRLQEQIHEWQKIIRLSEGKLDDLERKCTWSKLAIETKASEVIAERIITAETLREYEIARAKVESKGGGLRFVQSKLGDSAAGREIGLKMKGLCLHPRSDLSACFDELCLDANAEVPPL
jgi:hypothetical protein